MLCTGPAGFARSRICDDHTAAKKALRHPRPERMNDAAKFVAEQRWERAEGRMGAEPEHLGIGRACQRGRHLDDDLTRPRVGHRQIFESKIVDAVQNEGTHHLEVSDLNARSTPRLKATRCAHRATDGE
jgi:hypothetical protein